MTYYQLELFPETEIDRLRSELAKTKKELDNVRRGMFSRHAEHANMIIKLREDIDCLIREKNTTVVLQNNN